MLKIKSQRVLKRIIVSLQKRNKKVVATNGCFDILHVGHIRLFQFAKRAGDILVVAINTDDSVRRLKGNSRPLVNAKERAEVLSALGCVDYVTFFSEGTPEKVLRFLQPDILVKGSDYKFKEIVGHNFIEKIIRYPVVKGKSTSEFIKKIAGK
ncbi:MAG: D-glycero-beta-D-manno-heptose 1-phosphate adenylyltransferase [Elusimicrobia bacterium CG02_land_8_20_14_3_00_37_13]|nr:MAG: D-glycero-beta-D-manno-heptose 1-phosphate adenylyltransferase [Elusimicrobia bacterium CG02_land_8_20_14_3_00_37_13]